MQENKKIKIVRSIESENELRTELIIPLFRKMDYKVIDNQGPDEFGTDVILKTINRIGNDEYISLVLKKGDINNRAGSPNGILKIIRDQISQAAKMPLSHPEIKKNIYPNSIWLITNGKISNNAKSVLRRTLIEQFDSPANIEYLDVTNLVDLLHNYWPEFYFDRRPFLSQYSEYLRKQLLEINISDIAETNKSIETVLIPQLLLEKKNIDEYGNKNINIKKSPISPIQLITNKKNLLLVTGEAGAGKSTLLKRLAIEIANKGKNIPVVISANEVTNIIDNLDNIYSQFTKNDSLTPREEIIKEFEKSSIVLLVDGLDEIRDFELRKETLKNLIEIESANNNIEKIIITSRPESNSEILTLSKPITTFEVQSVQSTQVVKFFSKWFNNQKSKSEKLLRELTSKSILSKLPKTPLTLTLLAIVYETRDDLPTTLTELYRMFSELLLGKLDHKKGINSIKDSQVKSGMLSHIAFEMHFQGKDEISQEELLKYANDYMKNQLGDYDSDSKRIIQNIIDRSALLIPSNNKIKFRHLSFQEYFAARKIYCKNIFRENLSEWIEDSWWSEVLFFAAGSLKNIDDYIDILEKKNLKNIYSTIHSIGGMLQAAYETSFTNKIRLITFSKNHVPEIFVEARREIKNHIGQTLPEFVPYAIVTDFLSDNFSSSYLNSALEKVFEGVDCSSHESSLKYFFVAASLAKSGNISGIESLCTSPEMKSPIVLLLSDMMLDEYDSKYNNGKVSIIHKKIKKKIKKNMNAIRSVLVLKEI